MILFLTLITVASAQIPSLGYCPDYHPIKDFDIDRFLGTWYEEERYVTVSELGSRCVSTTYEMMPDGRVWVTNEAQNSFTGVKRVLDGALSIISRDGEGIISVKYTTLPVPYTSEFLILDTDYDSFAVVWSCSGIGPIHTQSAWILTRSRTPKREIIERTYAVLERFKIPSMFFTKTDQEDCATLPDPVEYPADRSAAVVDDKEKKVPEENKVPEKVN